MQHNKNRKYTISILLIIIAILLNGCNSMVLMNPKGQIGLEQRSLILISLGMMLIIVIPAILMTIVFAIKYRANNLKASYAPNWSNSKSLEIIIWFVPVIIVIILAIITWNTTHKLDPKRPIDSDVDPINIEVIALDWKWLFVYPQYKIATINEIAFPVNVPIKFNVTSNSVMNAFFIPQLGGQIYAMAGMNSTLNLIANTAGNYKGISSNFSGQGFSGMKFVAIVKQNQKEYQDWIKKIKMTNNKINSMTEYEQIAQASINHPVTYFSDVTINLFNNVVNKYHH